MRFFAAVLAVNLAGLATYYGIDLNPHCIARAKGRGAAAARFEVGFAEEAPRQALYWGIHESPCDAVVAYVRPGTREVRVMRGEHEVIHRDADLVRRLLRAAK